VAEYHTFLVLVVDGDLSWEGDTAGWPIGRAAATSAPSFLDDPLLPPTAGHVTKNVHSVPAGTFQEPVSTECSKLCVGVPHNSGMIDQFLQRVSALHIYMQSAVLAIVNPSVRLSVCLSVSPSVTRWH